MEYLYNPRGGRCSYAIGLPVIALEICLTLSRVPHFSVHRPYLLCSVAWGETFTTVGEGVLRRCVLEEASAKGNAALIPLGPVQRMGYLCIGARFIRTLVDAMTWLRVISGFPTVAHRGEPNSSYSSLGFRL
jgi:hypothetical protein